MIFDFQNLMVEGIVAFPDFVFPNLPKQGQVGEIIFIQGSAGNAPNIDGTADNQ